MVPRVQTFAWRLLRRALPTGKRAGRLSVHIKEECARCGAIEDDMHLLFLCPFSKAAWFSHPWYFRSEVCAATRHSIPDMINAILSSGHPFASLENVYTFMWCLWKARNDTLFSRKVHKPSQVFAATHAILRGAKVDDQAQGSLAPICNQQHQKHNPGPSPSLQDL